MFLEVLPEVCLMVSRKQQSGGFNFCITVLWLLPQVEFEDGSEITLKRENIWSEQEELPKRVKSRIVCRLPFIWLSQTFVHGCSPEHKQPLFEIRMSRDC